MFFYKLRKWWDNHGWGYILIGSLFLLFLLWFFYSRHQTAGTATTSMDDVLRVLFQPRSSTPRPITVERKPDRRSRGEQKCKEFLEYITGKPFVKVRPSFLLNPVTQHPLELDLYNEELQLAIEYNGSQHYHFNSMMHNSRDSFHNQKYRDLIKKQLCDQHGIRLVSVPYTIQEDKIPEFLYDRLKELHII